MYKLWLSCVSGCTRICNTKDVWSCQLFTKDRCSYNIQYPEALPKLIIVC